MASAIEREKAIKHCKRSWKLKTIEAMNPDWRDLYPELIWRAVFFAERETVDNRLVHLDSGLRRNHGISEVCPQILRWILILELCLLFL
ncbi:MAG: hypothetical protein ACH255_08060 [Candidatus Thiodiazotropha sp.]